MTVEEARQACLTAQNEFEMLAFLLRIATILHKQRPGDFWHYLRVETIRVSVMASSLSMDELERVSDLMLKAMEYLPRNE